LLDDINSEEDVSYDFKCVPKSKPVQGDTEHKKLKRCGPIMLTVSSLIAPIITIAVAVLVGVAFNFIPAKQRGSKLVLIVAFAGIIGILGIVFTFLLTNLLSDYIFNIGVFNNFAIFFQDIGIDVIKYNSLHTASIVLLGILEVGLSFGFGVAYTLTNAKPKNETINPSDSFSTPNGEKSILPQTAAAITDKLQNEYLEQATIDDDSGLRKDERSMVELFLFGKVHQIIPLVDSTNPEGYFFDGIPQLDWDTKHTRQVLDSLVRKNYLKAELIDKLTVCKNCSSGKVRVVTSCPECGSLRLDKEGLIEHISCGEVDCQSNFEAQNNDLICPKCKAKLGLIGLDYRVLPPAYKCSSCTTLNKTPRLLAKCSECESVEDLDDEPEILLYKYTANAQMHQKELDKIEPIKRTIQFFKSLGYSIVAPAYVTGKSGTQHLFDLLILGQVGWVKSQKTETNSTANRSDNGNTAVEVLVSSKPVNLAEITRINGKLSDMDCDFLLFAIPGLTANARNYAKANSMKVGEGKNIEDALADSKLPKVKS
jgi:hypothetical protein